MTKERDSQKGKLYKAEKILLPISQRLETVPEMEKYLKKVLDRAPIQRRYSRWLGRKIVVKDGRGCRHAYGNYNWIKMPRWARSQHIVLHEVAHALTLRKHGDAVADHGWQYAAIYLDLVKFGMGAEAHDALKASFKQHKVRFKAKVKRNVVVTAETLARLAAAREARKSK